MEAFVLFSLKSLNKVSSPDLSPYISIVSMVRSQCQMTIDIAHHYHVNARYGLIPDHKLKSQLSHQQDEEKKEGSTEKSFWFWAH